MNGYNEFWKSLVHSNFLAYYFMMQNILAKNFCRKKSIYFFREILHTLLGEKMLQQLIYLQECSILNLTQDRQRPLLVQAPHYKFSFSSILPSYRLFNGAQRRYLLDDL